jgi:serine/threonine-protein kinase
MELKRLGKYEIVAKIGQGGMGEVYRAVDPILNRDVAIKTMVTGAGMEEELQKRFLREARSSAHLNHPNIVTVYDFGEEQGRMYIVMELLEGTDLKQIIQGPRLPLGAQLDLMEQICDGLAFAHAKGVIHRDLKPANIHVSRDRHVKIMDFGLARLASSDITRAGLILGTPHYMSPEQVKGEPVTTRSDVFSLGAVFHELLTGRKAFEGESMPSVMYQVMHSDPPQLETLRADVPTALASVVRRALEKDPERRPGDASELGRALRAAAVVLSEATAPAGTPRPAALPRAPGEPARTRGMTDGQTALQPSPAEATRLEPTVHHEDRTAVPAETLAATRVESAPAAAAAPHLRLPRQRAPAGRGRMWAAAAGAGLVLAVGAGVAAVLVRTDPSPPAVVSPTPAPARPTPVPAPTADTASARRAIADRDYRRALELAEAALQIEPANAPAREAVAEAQRALRESEAIAGRVRTALRSRDSASATEALGRLVALDPRHPDLPSLTRGLETLVRATPRPAPPSPPPGPVASAPSPRPAELRPTPAPATPPPTPSAPPAPAAPAPEEAVLRTLSQYREACARVDSVAIRRVFPLIRDDNLKAISKMSRYDVRFENVVVRFEGERTAVVTCSAVYLATPRDTRRAASQWQGPQTIRLEKVDGSWVIRSID